MGSSFTTMETIIFNGKGQSPIIVEKIEQPYGKERNSARILYYTRKLIQNGLKI